MCGPPEERFEEEEEEKQKEDEEEWLKEKTQRNGSIEKDELVQGCWVAQCCVGDVNSRCSLGPKRATTVLSKRSFIVSCFGADLSANRSPFARPPEISMSSRQVARNSLTGWRGLPPWAGC